MDQSDVRVIEERLKNFQAAFSDRMDRFDQRFDRLESQLNDKFSEVHRDINKNEEKIQSLEKFKYKVIGIASFITAFGTYIFNKFKLH